MATSTPKYKQRRIKRLKESFERIRTLQSMKHLEIREEKRYKTRKLTMRRTKSIDKALEAPSRIDLKPSQSKAVRSMYGIRNAISAVDTKRGVIVFTKNKGFNISTGSGGYIGEESEVIESGGEL